MLKSPTLSYGSEGLEAASNARSTCRKIQRFKVNGSASFFHRALSAAVGKRKVKARSLGI